jgi:hypothetical protein
MANNMWTPQERNEWIAYASSTNKDREMRRGHLFYAMTKQGHNTSIGFEDPKRVFVTACLAKAMYDTNPILKRLSFCFYKLLMQKVNNNSFLATMQRRRHFIIVVKGSNAYKLLLKSLAKDIEHSDLDIVVLIDPSLEGDLYTRIKDSLVIAITQSISIYKRDMEATLFAGTENSILRQELVHEFKTSYMNMLKEYSKNSNKNDKSEYMVSPFEDDEARYLCSKRSFLITESSTSAERAARIEIPHFDKCECLPLKKSPLIVSYNKTISFDRDTEGVLKGNFELIRLRLNNICVVPDDETQDTKIDTTSDNASDIGSVSSHHVGNKTFVVPADFIDVSIPLKGDAVLEDFWSNGGFKRCYEVYDKFVGMNVMIPNVNQCIHDLSNMLNLYNNGQVKIEKRQKRLELFKTLDAERRKNGYGCVNDVNETVINNDIDGV